MITKFNTSTEYNRFTFTHSADVKFGSLTYIKIIRKCFENTLYFNDVDCTHWQFDFKFLDYWIENITWKNCLKNIYIDVNKCK